jgi:uncharacterized membrane protein YcaP (DUF421 family)
MLEPLSQLVDQAFGLSAEPRQLTAMQMITRAVFVFVSALAMLRLAHKRFFARRNALDVLLTLVIASTLARAINGNAAYFPTIVVGFVLVLVHRGLSWAAARSPGVGRMVKGNSQPLIEDGHIRQHALHKHDLSREDLIEDLRINGIEKPEQVRLATLERNGEVSVVKAS